MIEGSLGLGESVVSGQVSPDRYLVDKETMHIVKREVKRKELVIEPLPDGGTRTRELSGEEAKPVLSDDEVREVAELGRRDRGALRLRAGHRVGFDADGHAWMLQSRPVTAAGGDVAPRSPRRRRRGARAQGLGAAPGVGHGEVKIVSELLGRATTSRRATSSSPT